MRPRVLFVSRGRVVLPLAPWLARKWDALSGVFEVRALNAGSGAADPRFELLPEVSWAFFPSLPFAIARELRTHPAQAIVASDPYVGAAALLGRRQARARAKVIVELHGDPRTFTRLYGSPLRRLLSFPADMVARRSLVHADATRALSAFTSSLIESARGCPATASFPTYSDLSAFAAAPPLPVPTQRRLVFVGALEPYKNIDGLAAAWRAVAEVDSEATLVVVGRGSRRAVVEGLLRDLPRQVIHHPELAPAGVAAELDAARALVLPSYPEGLGRVVLEAFARGRPVIATDGGGIPDLVEHEQQGLLVPPYDVTALTRAMLRLLSDHELCVRLGAAARDTYPAWHQTAEGFADEYARLVERVLGGAR